MSLPVFRTFDDTDGLDTAFFVRGDTLTREEFIAQAQRASEYLSGRASYVINLSTCRYGFTLGFAAALLARLTSLLPSNRQVRTITNVVESYPGSLVLHDEALEVALSSELKRRGIAMIDLRSLALSSDASSGGSGYIPQEQLAAIVFTSGSTGEPKAIPKSWRTLTGTTALLRERFIGGGRKPSIVATVPPQHMYGLETTVLMSLQGGCSVSSAQPFYPADIAKALGEVPAPRILVTAPIHMRALLQSGVELPELDTVISATAPLSASMAVQAEKRWDCLVREIYGCSEAGSLASRRTATDSEWDVLQGIKLKCVDADVQVAAPHLSETVVLQDRLQVVAPNKFRFLGRSADMLNIAGKRASLAELTAQLQSIEGVDDGVFFLRDDEKRKVQRLAALVVSTRTELEITHTLAGQIDPAFMPRPLKKVVSIPRNDIGKISREQLLHTLHESGKHGV